MSPLPVGIPAKGSPDGAVFLSFPVTYPFLIPPKHSTNEARWRSPGCARGGSGEEGIKAASAERKKKKRGVLKGKADVTRRGRLALKTRRMRKKKWVKKNFPSFDSNLHRKSQHFWIAANGRYTDLSTHQKKRCFAECKDQGIFFSPSTFMSLKSKAQWRGIQLKPSKKGADGRCI